MNAAENAAQNDDGHQQRPDAFLEGVADLLGRLLFVGRQVLSLAVDQRIDDQAAGQQNTGDHRTHEQLRHRYVGDGGIHDQGDGGGDDGAED